jgi:uncharacterized membrane protein YhaH (DUF805 family)
MDKNVIDHVLLGKWRMNRVQFAGVFFLFSFIEVILLMIVGFLFDNNPSALLWPQVIVIVFDTLILTWIWIRRGHDLWIPTLFGGITGILPLLSIVVTIFSPVLFRWYGSNHIIMYMLFSSIIVVLYWALYNLILIILSGKKETNKYWEQPKDLKKISEIVRLWWTGKS